RRVCSPSSVFGLNCPGLEITQPCVLPPPFEFREPAAHRVKRHDHTNPNEINNGKVESRIRSGSAEGIVEKSGSRAASDGRNNHRQPVNQREMQQVIKERHAAEDEKGAE